MSLRIPSEADNKHVDRYFALFSLNLPIKSEEAIKAEANNW